MKINNIQRFIPIVTASCNRTKYYWLSIYMNYSTWHICSVVHLNSHTVLFENLLIETTQALKPLPILNKNEPNTLYFDKYLIIYGLQNCRSKIYFDIYNSVLISFISPSFVLLLQLLEIIVFCLMVSSLIIFIFRLYFILNNK